MDVQAMVMFSLKLITKMEAQKSIYSMSLTLLVNMQAVLFRFEL